VSRHLGRRGLLQDICVLLILFLLLILQLSISYFLLPMSYFLACPFLETTRISRFSPSPPFLLFILEADVSIRAIMSLIFTL
jgi:hypothetical protein